ncbi:DUF6968 family protein [Streptomyces sp. NPDC059443]|uniref:DUF6968 family protein n=1 Tax=unclassified Streptomyces TaxID=2593676 RepID=UPI0036CD85B9
MVDVPFGEVVASRELVADRKGGSSFPVVVRVGAPRRDTDPDGDWVCPCQLEGLGESRVWLIHGIDAVQALQLALFCLKGQIAAIAEPEGLTFTWLGESGIAPADILS